MRIRCTHYLLKRRAIPMLFIALAGLGSCWRALGDCYGSATNLDGITAFVGVNGPVTAMVEWDPDGPAGPLPNMMVVAGQFTSANGLSVPGLAGWDGTKFIDISGPYSVTYPKLLTTWDQDGPGAGFPKLVAVTDGPYPTMSIYDGLNWSGVVQFGADANVTGITTWDPYGTGQPLLVLGGDNLAMGGAGPSHLLSFDGTTWASVANITSSSTSNTAVTTLTTWDPDGPGGSLPNALVIGGNYSQINGKSANNVAYLVSSNGVSFSLNNLGGGVNGQVNALLPWDAGGAYKRLVIGGSFTQAGGADGANGLVFWTDQYYGFGIPQPQTTTALAFWTPNGIGQGPSWVVMSTFSPHEDPGVFYFDPSNNQFNNLVGGLLGGKTVDSVAPPVLAVWDVAGDGYQPQYLFAGGTFAWEIPGPGPFYYKPVNNIVRINTGEDWVTLPNVGLNLHQHLETGTVSAMLYAIAGNILTEPPRLYVGGGFDYAGAEEVNNFTAWTGSEWAAITAGLNGPVNCLFSDTSGTIRSRSNTLYAGGDFTASGSTALGYIGRFAGDKVNGYSWQALGSGLNGGALAMASYNGLVVVGGVFTTAGGAPASNIAAWNPTNSTWSALGSGISGVVYALAVWDPDGPGPQPAKLIAGGSFATAGGLSAVCLAEWDGVQWLPFDGGGINGGFVRTMMVWPDPSNAAAPRLVIGGQFSQAGGVAANNIALWRDSGWDSDVASGFTAASSLSGPVPPEVFALASADLIGPNTSNPPGQGPSLIAGGLFSTTGSGDSVANLARWDDINRKWTALGGGFGALLGGTAEPITAILPLPQAAGDRPRLLLGGRFGVEEPPGSTYNQGLVVWGGSDPYVLAAPSAQETNCPGTLIVLSATAMGDSLVYRWQRNGANLFPGPSGTGSILSDVTQPTLYITNCSAGDSGAYACAVRNSCGAVTTSVSQVTVVAAGCPPPPQITTAPALPSGQVGLAYSNSLSATNGFSPYTWTLQAGTLPLGLYLSLNGTLSGTPSIAGDYAFTIGLTDTQGESTSQAFNLEIAAPPLAILTTSPLPAGTVSNTYTFTLLATNGAPPYSWRTNAGALPAGLSLGANGLISGIPTAAGTGNFTAQVSDSLGSNSAASFALTILPAQPSITNTSPLPSGTLNNNYYLAFGATGGTPPYSWLVIGAPPPGLFLNGQGILRGNPTNTGTFDFQVQVNDSNGTPALQSFTLNIQPPGPIISNPPNLPPGQVGAAYNQSLLANGGFPPYTWTQVAGTLPEGLQLAPGGVLSGSPSQSGTFDFMLRVQEVLGPSTTEAFELYIAPAPLTITTPALPEGFVGTNYSFALSATNGAPPYSWSLSSGTLPGGLSLSGAGLISGTPTNGGASNFTVQVSDTLGTNIGKAFTLTIVLPPLAITTLSPLPAAPAQRPYLLAFSATGGEPPYLWSWSGVSPPGLFLATNGVMSGIPTTPGNFSFYVQATDEAHVTSIAPFAIQINSWAQVSLVSGQQVRLDFTAAPGLSYSVLVNDSLNAPSGWTVLSNIPPGSLPAIITLYDTMTGASRFYHIQTPGTGP